jgi:4-amino-4-deoxy-L-arabinose transferase-like glycosyltransferase
MISFKRIWTITLLLKLIVSALVPLTTDEAYYWVWSQHPQLSYYDHPPIVAWLFWLGHPLEFLGNAVRWPAVLLGHATLVIWYLIWKLLFPNGEQSKQFIWFLALALCSPLLGLGSIVVTPDLPVIFFWTLSLYFFLRVFQRQSINDYIWLGVSLGLGFCSKYHIVLFLPFLFLYLIFEKKWKEVQWKYVPLTVLFGLVFCSPVIIWNFMNDFASFKFQLKHGLSRPEYKFYWTWSYIAAQVLVIFPTVVWSALRSKLAGLSRALLYFGWGPLAFFLFSSFKALVEVNWPIVAYPAFFAVAALGAKSQRPLWVANIFWISLMTIVASHSLKPWIPNAPDKLSEFTQFKPLIDKLDQNQPLYASTYQMASWLWYKTKKPVYKLNAMSRFDLFDSFPEGKPTQWPIHIMMKRDSDLPEWIRNDSQYIVSEVESLDNDLIIVRISR